MWGPIIGAGISALGSLVGGRMQQNTSQEMAQEQMEFQERMSSTAHQRQVEDLRAAGLNPILSTRLGGASSPAGAMGTAVDFVGNATRAGVSTALAAQANEAQIENIRAQTAKTEAETKNANIDSVIKTFEASDYYLHKRGEKIFQDVTKTAKEVENISQETVNKRRLQSILESQGVSARSQADWDRIIGEFARTEAGRAAIMLGTGGRAVNPMLQGIHSGASTLRMLER